MKRIHGDDHARLSSRLILVGDCWLCSAYCDPDGYGRMQRAGRSQAAHRAAYELLVGPIPEGLTLDHLCRMRDCCNPAHLEPVPLGVNTLRSPTCFSAINARKTHCSEGHPFSGDNLYINPASGQRTCRACTARWQRDYQQRRKALA